MLVQIAFGLLAASRSEGKSNDIGVLLATHKESRPAVVVHAATEPALSAGLRPGDVLLAVNGEPIPDSREAINAILRHCSETLDIRVHRPATGMEIRATFKAKFVIRPHREPHFECFSGVGLRDGVAAITYLVIADTAAGSPAERAGLQSGDVIISVDESAVHTVEEFNGALNAVNTKAVDVIVKREDRLLSVMVDITSSANEAREDMAESGTSRAKESVRFLQEQVLMEFRVDGLEATGEWDIATAVGVTAYLKKLQDDVGFGSVPPDGLYTPEFSRQLSDWLATMEEDQEPIRTFSSIHKSLDYLVSESIYDIDLVRESLAPPPKPAGKEKAVGLSDEDILPLAWFDEDEHETIATMILVSANGFLWEFGDEIIGKVIEQYKGKEAAQRYSANVPDYLNTFVRRYPTVAMVATALGVWMSWGGVFAVMLARSKGRGFCMGFAYGCIAELIETAIAYYGEVSTFGHADIDALKHFSMYMVPITGLTVGVVTKWTKSVKSLYGTEFFVVLLLAGLAYYLFIGNNALQGSTGWFFRVGGFVLPQSELDIP